MKRPNCLKQPSAYLMLYRAKLKSSYVSVRGNAHLHERFFLSETITNELQTTLHRNDTDGDQIPNKELIYSEVSEDENTVEDDTHDPNDDTCERNDSITLMKQITSNNSEINKNTRTKKVNNENTKVIKLCCDSF